MHALEEARAAEVTKARERTAAAEADLAAKQADQERKRLELEVRNAQCVMLILIQDLIDICSPNGI